MSSLYALASIEMQTALDREDSEAIFNHNTFFLLAYGIYGAKNRVRLEKMWNEKKVDAKLEIQTAVDELHSRSLIEDATTQLIDRSYFEESKAASAAITSFLDQYERDLQTLRGPRSVDDKAVRVALTSKKEKVEAKKEQFKAAVAAFNIKGLLAECLTKNQYAFASQAQFQSELKQILTEVQEPLQKAYIAWVERTCYPILSEMDPLKNVPPYLAEVPFALESIQLPLIGCSPTA